MKKKNAKGFMACLLLVMLTHASASPTDGRSSDEFGLDLDKNVEELYSPDGVYLLDFQESSILWGRIFTVNEEFLQDIDALVAACQAGAPENESRGFEECMFLYSDSVAWRKDGVDAGEVVGWDGSPEADPDGFMTPSSTHDELVEVIWNTVFGIPSAVTLDMKTNTFHMYDNIDCDPSCNKNLDGYVKFIWKDPSGSWSTSPKKFCQDQNVQGTAWCGANYRLSAKVDRMGPESCFGVNVKLELWDDDSGSPDDLTDINSRLGSATANIQAMIHEQTDLDCVEDEQGLWWNERGNFDSPSNYRCHSVGWDPSPDLCWLTGQYDTSTSQDNDDAGITYYMTRA